jgi:methionyl-tRNA formyltransferase
MRVVYLGTPEFAVPTLDALASASHEILAVYTQPDRPKGRGGRLAVSPVKNAAIRLKLPVFQPERIRRPENVATLAGLHPDVIVVVGYGQIIPQSIIDIPRHGILNVHASLLPKYRGAAPIQWAVANGEPETGVTIMRIDAGLDTGDILLKWATPIHPNETTPELSSRLAAAGASLLIEALRDIEAGTAEYTPQNDAEASSAPILKKEDGRIDWSQQAQTIYNRLRGFTPWPGAYSTFRSRTLHVLRAAPHNTGGVSGAPGTLYPDKRRLFVACGRDTSLELLEVQLEGKKRMSVADFLNGHSLQPGESLGGTH